jgi:hypothetical protein
MYYRRIATGAVCGVDTSASAQVTVAANLTQTNPSAATVCYNTTATLSPGAASGGSGTIAYQWQQSTNNSSWATATGASTNAAYTTPVLTANMYYRRIATGATCGAATSTSALVTAAPNLTQTNPSAATVCYNAATTLSPGAASGGSGTIAYQWQQSANNSSWATATGTNTNAAYTTPALTTTMYYRRIATGATCGAATSTSALVTVRPNLTQTSPSAATVCYNAATTLNPGAASGGYGTISYQWQQSTNNSSWANATGTRTNAAYTTPALTTTMYYRRIATGATCGAATSTSAPVTVRPNLTQTNPASTSVCSGRTVTLSPGAASGGYGTISYRWQQSTNNSTWANATGTNTNAAYTTPALTTNTYYRRIATGATCGASTSTSALVSILPASSCGGTINCNGLTYTVYSSNSGTATIANAASKCPSGWRLPTAAELKCMYQRNQITTGTNYWYWSSQTSAQATPDCNCGGTTYIALITYTINCTTCACNSCQPYTAGRLYGVFSHNSFYVRCVR